MTILELPFAEDINYWKTTHSAADKIIDDVVAMITKAGGTIHVRAFGQEDARAAFMLDFTLDGQRYRAIWPVLPSKVPGPANDRAARIQAAVMLKHDIKAKLVSALVQGTRSAFFSYLLLPTGQVLSDIAEPDLLDAIPKLLLPTFEGEYIEEGQ